MDQAKDLNSTRNIADLLFDFLAAHPIPFLCLLLLTVVTGAIVEGHAKPLWYDEVFTFIVAMQPTLHRIWESMPAESSPPLYPLFVRFFIPILGTSDFAARLPALLGFLGALVGVFVFVRRESGAVFGLIAALLVCLQPGWVYSFEARPYGLLLGFLMLALVSWQSATRAGDAAPLRPRGWALAGMVVGIVGCMLTHNLGIVEVGAPLLVGEAVRTWQRRRLDWPVIATGLAAIPTLAFTLPMAHRSNALLYVYVPVHGQPFLHRFSAAGPKSITGTLQAIISYQTLRILPILIVLSWAPHFLNRGRRNTNEDQDRGPSTRPPSYIVAAAAATALLIPITWFVMTAAGNQYNCRYGIGTIAGIAILGCLLLGREQRGQSLFALTILAVASHNYLSPLLVELIHRPVRVRWDSHIYDDHTNLPIVVSDPFRYLPMWWYAPAGVKERLVYLEDKPVALQNKNVIVELAMIAEKPVIAADFENYGAFTATHDHFLVDQTGVTPALTLKQRLETSGYRMTPVYHDYISDIYEASRADAP